ncbi:hypothetical protein CAP35_03255 [Chitinophagaceae bacterium IBVUCB1]|nr:hypothetical protein CAP35_03255 [Chitinophagaceae bacterium IBVUCB1]
MNKTKSIVVASLMIGLGLVSCTQNGSKHRNPGKIYAPDMTYSRAYDAYTANPNFADGQTSRKPIAGTVAMGHELPDHMVEGDTNGYKTFTTALRFNEAEMAEGKRLFNIYCGICHGTNLDGQGPLYASGKFAAMPANLKDAKYLRMPSGTMYAAIKYGKGVMGSYASQLDIKQRWMVIAYIKKVQAENGGDAFTLGAAATTSVADTTKAVAATTETAKH